MKKNKTMKQFASILNQRMGQEANPIIEQAYKNLEQLIDENPNESKALQAHTVMQLYPAIALYKSLLSAHIEKEKAVDIIDDCLCTVAQVSAKQFRTILKFPGLYKLLPRIYKWMTVNKFGEEVGFKQKFYPTDSTRCKFDMTHCVYKDYCQLHGCPEILRCFCHTDDITSGNMHPKICWNRTQTMGEGAEYCDFDIFIRK